MSRCLIVLLFALVVHAQEAPPQYHFLFIVDTSISMAERKPASIVAVRDVIRSFFGSQIEPGDLLDIWTRDHAPEEERFPALQWNPRRGGTILTIVGDYLSATKFHRGNHVGPVLRELREFAPTTKGLIVVLLTDGEEPITGFDFDADLNHEVARLRHEAQIARRPILIGLSAIDGQFAEWRVKIGADPAVLPKLPKREKPLPTAAAPAPITQAEPEMVLPQPQPEPERPAILNLPPGAKILPVAAQPAEPPPVRREPAPQPVPVSLPEAHSKMAETPATTTVQQPNPTSSQDTKTAVPAPAPISPVTTTPVGFNTQVLELVIKTNAAAARPEVNTSKQSVPAPVPVAAGMSMFKPVYLLGAFGSGLVITAVLLAVNARTDKRSTASLISRSLAK
jgi:hypothetical protein